MDSSIRYFSLCMFIISFILTGAPANAETVSKSTDCVTLSLSSSEISSDGTYNVDATANITSGHYIFFTFSQDGNILDSGLSFSNSFSRGYEDYNEEHTYKLEIKSGLSHSSCSAHIELIVKVNSDPIEMAGNLCSAITDLENNAFINNPRQRKNAFCNKLDEVAAIIDYGDHAIDPVIQGQLYMEAMEKLSNDIGAKMDSSFGGKANNDWIINPEAQKKIYTAVKKLIEAIQDKI